MKRLVLLFALIFTFSANAQNSEGTELGLDGTFYASNLGGTIGLGVKYGWKFKEYFIAGPSIRYQRTWSKQYYTGTTSGFNVFGGGGFIHARFFNVFFVGAELELLRTPYINGNWFSSNSGWAPTGLLGGGFSMEVNESWRFNAGIMYDVINSDNSPLRTQYFLKTSQGILLPVIYRISFFFPITGN